MVFFSVFKCVLVKIVSKHGRWVAGVGKAVALHGSGRARGRQAKRRAATGPAQRRDELHSQTDFSRKGFVKRIKLDHTIPKSHVASCTECATENLHIRFQMAGLIAYFSKHFEMVRCANRFENWTDSSHLCYRNVNTNLASLYESEGEPIRFITEVQFHFRDFFPLGKLLHKT